jgi:urease accessory protein
LHRGVRDARGGEAVSVVEAIPHVESVTARSPRAGSGTIEFERVSDSTAVVRRMAHSPLKLLTPRSNGPCAHVVTSTYGGGLLAGDEISLRLRAGDGTRCVLGTQASTKVYRGGDATSRQSVDADVGRGAVLAVAPDPVTCFAGSRYEQRQRFRLAETASLLLIDWLTSGRAARGERWAFGRYRTETRIDVGGTCVARDATLLEADGATTVAERMGRFDCVASVFLLGPDFTAAAAALLERLAKSPVGRRAPLVASASPLRDGALLRVAGGAAEQVGRFISRCLGPAWDALGEDPWSRKW